MAKDSRPDGGARLTVYVPMRWGDMDAYGHINNVEVLRIMEEARIHAFGPPAGTGKPGTEVELPIFSDLPEGTQALVVEHRVKYLVPLDYRNVAARIEVWISAAKGAKLTVAYAIYDPVTGVKCAVAESTVAFFHEGSGTVLRIPAEKKALLAPLHGESNFR